MPENFERRLIHKGRKFDFESVRFVGRSGREATLEVVRHPGAVVIVPLLSEGRIALISNRRPALDGRRLWELPAGTLEKGEDPAAAAPRELEEETGYRAGRIVPIASFYTTPGMTDELMHAFLATDLREVGQRLEEDEDIETRAVGAQEALAMIDRSEIVDAKSMLALLLADRRSLLGPRRAAT